jgi:copper chaperone CopZ
MDKECHVEPVRKTIKPEEMEVTTQVTLAIQGMGCPNCAIRVQNSLIKVSGVIEAEVNHMSGVADVVYNPNLTTQKVLVEAVVHAGGDGRHSYSAQIFW